VVAGFAVTTHADDTPANATDALITKINASGTEAVTAIDISANEILLVADAVGATTTTCSETMGGANNEWAATNMYGGSAAAIKRIGYVQRDVTATEDGLDTFHAVFDFAPTAAQAWVKTSSSDVTVLWNGDMTITAANKSVTLNNDGGTDFDSTSTIFIVAYE